MATLRGAMNLAQWIIDRREERASAIQLIEEECKARSTGKLMGQIFFETLTGPMPLSTVRAIRDRIKFGDAISVLAINGLIGIVSEQHREPSEVAIRCLPLEYAAMRTDMELRYTARGLDFYPGLFEELTGDDWFENNKLLSEATLHIWENYASEDLLDIRKDKKGNWTSFSIKSEATAALILERRDRYDEIMEIIGRRETVDAELIASILDSDARALSDGAL